MPLIAHCLPRLGLRLPSAAVCHSTTSSCLQMGDVADPTFGVPSNIDILLGASVYRHLLRPGLVQRGDLLGQLTVFGWTFTGQALSNPRAQATTSCLAVQEARPTVPWPDQLVSLMQRFWEVEDVPQVVRQSPSDVECEAIFALHRRAADRRYIVRLPLRRNGRELLGDSLSGAIASLRSLQRRLQRDPEMAAEYQRFMEEYEACGHMKRLSDAEVQAPSPQPHYIPHHGIWQSGDQKRKLRVVFNASRPTSSGYSLNDALHAGPKLQTALPNVLLRWRLHRVAFCADMRMMFRQIWINEEDADLQRVVWSPDTHHEPRHYRLLTVTYGTSCAPYLSLRTLQQLCQDVGHRWPEAVPMLRRDRYADDILSGADDVETARVKRDQVIALLESGGFPLRKWVANSPELLRDLPEEVRLRSTWRQLSTEGLVSELGVRWDPVDDCFQLTPPSGPFQPTKRAVLAALARLFDPCGWLAPAILVAKLLIQDLWRARLDWDEAIPASMAQRWTSFLAQLPQVSGVSIPRWIGHHPSAQVELHAFSDASRRAMAAVVYSRARDAEGRVRVSLLLAKTKLSPIKSLVPTSARPARMTIPRLELRAALLAARLLLTATQELAVPFERCYAWSDSQIVLQWLRSPEPTHNSLVDNYVAHVQELVPARIWRHVPTECNPADVASRGLDFPTLQRTRIWWDGPAWLPLDTEAWPKERPVLVCCLAQHAPSALLEKFSELSTLLRFLARMRRWIRRRLKRELMIPLLGPLTVNELHEAYLACVRLSQRRFFADELERLHGGHELPARHPLTPLAPFVAEDGVLRVGGRLQHSSLSYDERHPPILSGACSLAQLVIAWAHTSALHGGLRVTTAYVTRRAWIVGGRRRIRAHLRKCVTCVRLQARASTQLMAPLPAVRTTPARAFSRVGVDYAGPFNILAAKGRGIRTSKGYIAVFVCLGTKALHLELVGDMTTESFLGALTRFCSRRGRPAEIWSDNGTCFRRADRELREALQHAELSWDLVAGALAEQGVRWTFIPPRAPHFGGLWEAGVKSVKAHLRRTVGSRNLTFEEFSTVLASIELVLNSRPLTPLTGGPDDLEVLTPGHFLIGGPLASVIELGAAQANLDQLAHWKLVRGIRDQFWIRWSREYLNTLQQRPKWRTSRRNFEVGDVVVLLDPTLLLVNGHWPLGRIVSVHPGPDGLVRAVTVKTLLGEYVRPIAKLALLPVTAERPAADVALPGDLPPEPRMAGGM